MPEDNESLSRAVKLISELGKLNQRDTWGYRAAFLAFASFLLSAIIVFLLQLWQPVYNGWAIAVIVTLFFFISFTIAVGAFGARKE